MFLAADISAIKTGLTNLDVDDDKVDSFVASLDKLAGSVDGDGAAMNDGDVLLREIRSSEVGGSDAGASFAFHQRLARAKSLEVVHELAETLRRIGATTDEYKRDVKRTDDDIATDVRRIHQWQAEVSKPDFKFDDAYENGIPSSEVPHGHNGPAGGKQ